MGWCHRATGVSHQERQIHYKYHTHTQTHTHTHIHTHTDPPGMFETTLWYPGICWISVLSVRHRYDITLKRGREGDRKSVV